MPHLDPATTIAEYNFNAAYGDPSNPTATAQTIGKYIRPSEVRTDKITDVSYGYTGWTKYAFYEGDWFVWAGPNGGAITRSAFGPNLSRRWSEFIDAMSQTIVVSEVTNYTPTVWDCGSLSQINDPNNIPGPDADPKVVAPEYTHPGNRKFFLNGHTRWSEIAVHHVGMTTA
jgi:hypothetical protein